MKKRNNEKMEDFSGLYGELYDKDGNYIGPKRINNFEEKEEFFNEYKKDRIENIKDFEINPSNLKRHFLRRAAPLIDDYIDRALGIQMPKTQDVYAQTQVWEILKTIILEAKNPAPMLDIKGKTIDEQVNQILTLVSTGKCTLHEAQEYLSLVQQGFELTELPKLMQQMESLEALGVIK